MCPAYSLREEQKTTFAGGVLAAPDGRDFNVAEALQDGDGLIVVPDAGSEPLVGLLDSYPPLKRTKAPERATPEADGGYERYTLDELRREARARSLEGLGSKTKSEVIAALEQHDSAATNG